MSWWMATLVMGLDADCDAEERVRLHHLGLGGVPGVSAGKDQAVLEWRGTAPRPGRPRSASSPWRLRRRTPSPPPVRRSRSTRVVGRRLESTAATITMIMAPKNYVSRHVPPGSDMKLRQGRCRGCRLLPTQPSDTRRSESPQLHRYALRGNAWSRAKRGPDADEIRRSSHFQQFSAPG